ncbi:MAG: G5 domain-containing protein [Ruminococcus sp.]
MAINKKSLLRIVAVALATIIIFATVLSVAALTNDSAAADGTDKETLTTSDINTDNILDKASIQLDSEDEVIRTDNNGVISLTILRAFPVTIDNKGEKTSVSMTRGTVKDALDKAGITLAEDEKVTPSLNSEVSEGTEIKISNSVSVDITLMGETASYEVPAGTVEDALASVGAVCDKNDKLNVGLNDKVYEDMDITLVKVTVKNETETQVVDYKTTVKKDSTMEKGTSEITRYGVEGSKTVTNRNTYEDGVLVSTKVVSSEVTKKPVNQIKVVGTKTTASDTFAGSSGGAGTFVDNSGNTVSYKKIITGSGTAYTAKAGSLTATGAKASVGGVAVNPNIIPYGSKMYITASDGSYVYGYATAVDTGGALMDGSAIVDLFMDSYADCANFGRRDVTIYIL